MVVEEAGLPPASIDNGWGRLSFASLFSSPDASLPAATGIKPVMEFKGEPAIYFSQKEISLLVEPFRFTLICKFTQGKPSMEAIRKEFRTIGLKGGVQIGWLDPRHVLIRPDKEEDFL